MRTRSGKRTFIEDARREQIVQSAIETIAELGYARASLDQIAKCAGLSSKGLISYHFANKGELIGEVLSTIYGSMGRFMHDRVGTQTTATGALRAYIEGTIEFLDGHRHQMTALLEIFLGHGAGAGPVATEKAAALQSFEHVEKILAWGQRTGEFRDFDVRAMAVAVQKSLEALPVLLTADPELDLSSYAREFGTLFALATKAEGS
ncbi:MAG TPA: TetR/AcrR family transcriptional regulator [Actinopolymorphaceae bacterium]